MRYPRIRPYGMADYRKKEEQWDAVSIGSPVEVEDSDGNVVLCIIMGDRPYDSKGSLLCGSCIFNSAIHCIKYMESPCRFSMPVDDMI